ncbi:MAG: hypothetical protein ABIF77_06560 [bacterium]
MNSEPASTVLTLADTGGWLREGKPWQAEDPFFALLGEVVESSPLPGIQRAAMRSRSVAATYLTAHVSAGGLRGLKQATWPTSLLGFNVTPSLGEEAARLCDRLTVPAQEIGVVDTVRVDGDRWFGHNTGISSLQAVMSQAWPDPEPPVSAAVFGAAGSLRATVSALAHWGVESIVILCQGVTARRRLRDWLDREWLGAGIVSVRVTDPDRDDADGDKRTPRLCVVCLPPGEEITPYLSGDDAAAPGLILDPRCGAQAAAYPNLPPTTVTVGGEPVLVLQCGFSFVWWFGPPVPWDDIRRAVSL